MRVLVGYDGSMAADRGLEVAANLARRVGDVNLGIVNVAAAADVAMADANERQERLLRTAREIIGRQGRNAVTLRRQGRVAQELIAVAHEISADLLVVGSRGRRPFKAALLGSVSSELAASANTPVLIVPPDGHMQGESVIAAVDRSPTADVVVRVASRLSRLLALPLLVAHSFTPRPVPGSSAVPKARQEFNGHERARSRMLLSQLAHRHGIAPGATRLAEGRHEVRALVQLADDERAALVVVGSRGRNALTAAVLGSFSSILAATATCPVVVVPPAAHLGERRPTKSTSGTGRRGTPRLAERGTTVSLE